MWFELIGVHITTERPAMDARTWGPLSVQGTCLSFFSFFYIDLHKQNIHIFQLHIPQKQLNTTNLSFEPLCHRSGTLSIGKGVIYLPLFLLNWKLSLWKSIKAIRYTFTMAGSWGTPPRDWGLGASQTCKSLMSLPRKIMYSKISSRGGTGRSVGRSSVPKERTTDTEICQDH